VPGFSGTIRAGSLRAAITSRQWPLGLLHGYGSVSRILPRDANSFAFSAGVFQVEAMTEPLALVLYERLLPGSQLVNRLQDLNYRVRVIADAAKLEECAEQARPMLVLADLESSRNNVCPALARLRQNPATHHLPIIAFGGERSTDLHAAAKAAGVTLLVSETGILDHLPQFLDQALQVE